MKTLNLLVFLGISTLSIHYLDAHAIQYDHPNLNDGSYKESFSQAVKDLTNIALSSVDLGESQMTLSLSPKTGMITLDISNDIDSSKSKNNFREIQKP